MLGFISLYILLRLVIYIRSSPICGANEEWNACGLCDENCYTTSVSLPFQTGVHSVSVGTTFEVKGYLPENIDGTQFAVEFRTGHGKEEDDKALYFNPRGIKVVSLNSYDDKEWGEEESCIYTFEVGRPFTVLFNVQADYFEIEVNGKNICKYKHRLDFSAISYIFIDGEIRIQSLFQENKEGQNIDLLKNTSFTTIDLEQQKEIYARWQSKFEKALPKEDKFCKPLGRCRCKSGFVRHEKKCIPCDRCKLLKLPELPTCPKTDSRFINHDAFKMHTRPDPTCNNLDNFTAVDHCGPPGCQCYSPVFVRDSFGRCIPRWDCDKDLECHNLKCQDNFTCELSKIWKCWERTCFPMITCGSSGIESHIFIFPECDMITCPNGFECALKNASFSFREYEDVATETPICLKTKKGV
uniref:Galectin n=1 Tax=Acrobeloides nanus TaxID=290746 RepID=A0A914C877_9BILA